MKKNIFFLLLILSSSFIRTDSPKLSPLQQYQIDVNILLQDQFNQLLSIFTKDPNKSFEEIKEMIPVNETEIIAAFISKFPENEHNERIKQLQNGTLKIEEAELEKIVETLKRNTFNKLNSNNKKLSLEKLELFLEKYNKKIDDINSIKLSLVVSADAAFEIDGKVIDRVKNIPLQLSIDKEQLDAMKKFKKEEQSRKLKELSEKLTKNQ